MNDGFSIILSMIIPVLILLLAIVVKRMAQEINELKEKLEQHQMKLKQLDFCNLSDYEERLDQLEEALELKEYYDDASRNKNNELIQRK